MAETAPEAVAGQRVEARSGGRIEYQTATITRNNGDGTYNVMYSDGDEEAGVKAGLIRIKTTYNFYFHLVDPPEEDVDESEASGQARQIVGSDQAAEAAAVKLSHVSVSPLSPLRSSHLEQVKSKEGHALPLRHDPRELVSVFNVPRWWELCWFGSTETDAIFGSDVEGRVYGSFCNWYNNGAKDWSWSSKTTPTFYTGPGDTAPYPRGVSRCCSVLFCSFVRVFVC
jgi:hypothetical protein